MVRFPAIAMTLALFSASAFAQTAPVANVSDVDGRAQINQGNGFVPLREGQAINPGDRIMVMDGGEAEIKFNDGCTLEIEEETIVTVPETSTCAGGVATVQAIEPATAAAPGTSRAAYAGGVDWRGFWTVAAVVIIGDAILFAQDDFEQNSP